VTDFGVFEYSPAMTTRLVVAMVSQAARMAHGSSFAASDSR
jgi:hypothetical protein